MPEVISYQKFSNISSVRLQQAALYLQTSRHIYFSFIFIIKFRSVFGFQITSIPWAIINKRIFNRLFFFLIEQVII